MKRCFAAIVTLALLAVCVLPGAAVAEGDSVYRTLYTGEITTLNYLYTSTTNEFALAANVIDTLVEYDQYGNIQPSLAESWDVSARCTPSICGTASPGWIITANTTPT